jgi:hypothetical protein
MRGVTSVISDEPVAQLQLELKDPQLPELQDIEKD